MSRKNIPPKILDAENDAITQFLFDATVTQDGNKLPLQYVFTAYELWRKGHSLTPTRLNIDGFGRLFPHVYPRKSAYWPAAKGTLKCVFNLGLKV